MFFIWDLLNTTKFYVIDTNQGLAEANLRLGTKVEIEEIEIVPDDYPASGQVKYCTMKLVEHYVQKLALS